MRRFIPFLFVLALIGCASTARQDDDVWKFNRGFLTGEFHFEQEYDKEGNVKKVKAMTTGWWSKLPGVSLLSGLSV